MAQEQEKEKKYFNQKWLLLLLLLFGFLFYWMVFNKCKKTPKDSELASLEEQKQDKKEESLPPITESEEEIAPEIKEDLPVTPTTEEEEGSSEESSPEEDSFVSPTGFKEPKKKEKKIKRLVVKERKKQPIDIILRDFEKIQSFIAEDPITKEECSIKDFEILKNRELTYEDYDIYDNFLAQDPITKKMYHVGIVEQIKNTRKEKEETVELEEENKEEEAQGLEEAEEIVIDKVQEKAKEKDSKWKYFVLSIHGGVGPTFYTNRLQNMQLIKKDKDFFIKNKSNIYKPNWFNSAIEKQEGFYDQENSDAIKQGDNKVLTGIGVSSPITIALHYTFFKRFLVGGGGEILWNYLKKVETKDTRIGNTLEERTDNLKDAFFFQRRLFVMLGWRCTQNSIHNLLLDFKVHWGHNVDGNIKSLINSYIHKGVAFNLGGTYERRLNCYIQWISRLGYEFYYGKNSINENDYGIVYTQYAPYLQIGFNFNFAKDTTGQTKKRKMEVKEGEEKE